MSAERRRTHTQFSDKDGIEPCDPGEHLFITVDPDDDAGSEDYVAMICERCGVAGEDS